MRRGEEFSIRVGNVELMNSRVFGSEQAMAALAARALAERPRAHWLIGGLGMGFTLRAALKGLGPEVQVSVAELVPAIVHWARGPLAALYGDCLDDPRLRLVEADVRRVIRDAERAFDAILLDVDNGPEGLTSDGNHALYGQCGLEGIHRALTEAGVLSVWSAGPDEKFSRRLSRAGFVVQTHSVRARGRGGGARHVIWIAKKR